MCLRPVRNVNVLKMIDRRYSLLITYRRYNMWTTLLLACLAAASPARAQQTRPNRVVDVASSCDRSAFAVHLTLDQPFKGLVFSKDFSRECRVQG